jgi:hypothetical protein
MRIRPQAISLFRAVLSFREASYLAAPSPAAPYPAARSLTARSLSAAALLAASSLSAGLCGCGSPEAAKAPAPVQVKWTRADGAAEPEEAPSAESEATPPDAPATSSEAQPGEVDLDELAAKKEALAAKKAAPKPAPKPAPREEPPAPAPAPVAAAPAPEPEPEPVAPVPLGNEMRAAVKGNEKPSPPSKKPPPKKAAARAPAAEPAAAAYGGPNPCRTTHFSVPRVEEACAANGRAGAKGVMKDAIGKALAAGASLKCGDCHAEQKDYTLKKDAVAQLKKWLGP